MIRTTHRKMNENASKGNTEKVYCISCNRETRHVVLQSIDEGGSEPVDRSDPCSSVDWSNEYQIIQCQGCETISFRHVNWFSEYQDFDDHGITEKLYPSKVKVELLSKEFINVPRALRRIYRETIDCYNLACLTMCAAGLRTIVEGICAEKGVVSGPVEIAKKGGRKIEQSKNLAGKIGGLCEKGILTKVQSNVLHEHRFLGNDALHALEQPSASELRLAIGIIEHTLEALYEIPDKAEELRQRKAKRQAKKAT